MCHLEVFPGEQKLHKKNLQQEVKIGVVFYTREYSSTADNLGNIL